jgi:hypothetical protein
MAPTHCRFATAPVNDTMATRRLALQQAMRLTERTIRLRLISYRCLVIIIGLIALISLLLTAIMLSWRPLLGFLLFLPLTGAFLHVDCVLVNRWRRNLLARWARAEVDLDMFSQVLEAIGVMPVRTLQSMLSSLPTLKNLNTSYDIAPPVRWALAATLHTINACQSDRTLFASIAFTTVLASLALAAALPSWLALAGVMVIVPIRLIGLGAGHMRWRRLQAHLADLLPTESQRRDFVNLAARLDWQATPAHRKARLLGAAMGPAVVPRRPT